MFMDDHEALEIFGLCYARESRPHITIASVNRAVPSTVRTVVPQLPPRLLQTITSIFSHCLPLLVMFLCFLADAMLIVSVPVTHCTRKNSYCSGLRTPAIGLTKLQFHSFPHLHYLKILKIQRNNAPSRKVLKPAISTRIVDNRFTSITSTQTCSLQRHFCSFECRASTSYKLL